MRPATKQPPHARSPHLVSRRQALLLAGTAAALACRSERNTPAAPLAQPDRDVAELEVARVGPAELRGGNLVVLLHGWGAPGDDLVPLARALAHPQTRFLVPSAPLARPGGGLAWWQLGDPADRPAPAWSDDVPPGHREHRHVQAARKAVQALIRRAQREQAPERVAVVGFSQGAMLALHVALASEPVVDRVAVLSGVLLTDSLPALRAPRTRYPAVFVSHGRSDRVVPFAAGETIGKVLAPRGYSVTWHPFEGGHEIPAPVVERLREFLFAE